MIKDWNHDLVQQLSEVSDSLWRMDEYSKNAEGCEHCSALWAKLRDEYNKHSDMLVEEIKRHVNENRFD